MGFVDNMKKYRMLSDLSFKLCSGCITVHIHKMRVYLQNSAHPLEAVFLGGVGPLLCHDHDPLIVKHSDGEHCYPETQTHSISMLLSFLS